MCLREDIAKEARKNGSAAFKEDVPIQWNPYQVGTMECRKWYEGWNAAANFALEEELFPKAVRDSDEYISFKRCFFPDSKALTTVDLLSHWWWNRPERKRLFNIWKEQE